MTRRHFRPVEPVPSVPDRTGSPSSSFAVLEPALEIARAWAGPDRLALIVSGSHAGGEAVWAEHEGRRVSLSDLDVYAVVRDEAAKQAARARARADRDGLAERLLALGLAAPLEVGFHTAEDLERLPARPATLALSRHGRVIEGDAAWLGRLPAWAPRDVSDEEILLLHENRGFELIYAECLAHAAGLDALLRRHAVFKAALDIAGVRALAAGEFPDGGAAQVAWARAHAREAGGPEPPWDEALAWRAGRLTGEGAETWRDEFDRTVRAWAATWRRLVGDPGDPEHPLASVRRVAARASTRRRLREAIDPGRPAHAASGLLRRATFAARGTPQHRLNASGAAFLLWRASLTEQRADQAMRDEYLAVMRSLGYVEGAASPEALFAAWNRGVLGGQRAWVQR